MNNEKLSDLLLSWGVPCHSELEKQISLYKKQILFWNKKMNLTRITSDHDMYFEHFLDSLMVCKFVSFDNFKTVLDLGTGAGFPGLPIKLVYPKMGVTLVDAQLKKINFLNNTIKELALSNIEAIQARGEDLGRTPNYRGGYSVVVTRAVSAMNILLELSLPLLEKEGVLLAWKTEQKYIQEASQINNALSILGGEISNKYFYKLPTKKLRHVIIEITKISETPEKYPRRAGIPEKRPL